MLPDVWCSGIKEVTGSVSKSGNLELGEEMVQYCYEPVQGDQVRGEGGGEMRFNCDIVGEHNHQAGAGRGDQLRPGQGGEGDS